MPSIRPREQTFHSREQNTHTRKPLACPPFARGSRLSTPASRIRTRESRSHALHSPAGADFLLPRAEYAHAKAARMPSIRPREQTFHSHEQNTHTRKPLA